MCQCYSVSDNNGEIRPVLCDEHTREFDALVPWRVSAKYERWFATEQDAADRERIIRNQYPSEGYGTRVNTYPVSRWHLVRADWGSAD